MFLGNKFYSISTRRANMTRQLDSWHINVLNLATGHVFFIDGCLHFSSCSLSSVLDVCFISRFKSYLLHIVHLTFFFQTIILKVFTNVIAISRICYFDEGNYYFYVCIIHHIQEILNCPYHRHRQRNSIIYNQNNA